MEEMRHKRWIQRLHSPSHKELNKSQKIRNGNRTEQLKIIHWNGGSRLWKNKKVELEALLLEQEPDLCFITEANLWAGSEDHEREILGHYLVLPNTMHTLLHARIVLIVKEGLDCVKLNQFMDTTTAAIWVRIGKTRKNAINVGGIYREQNQLGQGHRDVTRLELQEEQEKRWECIVRNWKAAGRRTKCIAIGDMNLDQRRWAHPEPHLEKMVENCQEHIETEGFVQLISRITRSWEGHADSILDHIWVNCANCVLNHFNVPRGASDHNVIGVKVSTREIKVGGQNILKRRWKSFDAKRFLMKLGQIDWGLLYEQTNPNIANSILEENILKVLESEAPMGITQQRTHYMKWIKDETKLLMTERDQARECARLTQLNTDWQAYRRLRNICTTALRRDRKEYLSSMYERIEGERDSARLHSLTRQLLGWKGGGPPKSFLIDGKTTSKQSELANIQAEYYVSKVKKVKENLPKVRTDPLMYLRKAFTQWQPVGGRPVFQVRKTTPIEVIKMLQQMKDSHAFGIDGLDSATMKMARLTLARPISVVINLSLETRKFPQKWKIARVIPLLKSTDSDKTSPSGYRPVSQLPIVSKLAERTVQVQLLEFLERTGQISRDHHAYRKYTSTTTALLRMMDVIAQGADENKIIATMNIDQTAAFDSVEHDLLLQKLRYYGIGGETMEWIVSYLECRSSFVAVGSGKSRIYSNEYGVPQGSCLGPLLYLVYVNEFGMAAQDDDCEEDAHRDTQVLFGRECEECGKMTIFADDVQYSSTSDQRWRNQDRIENVFFKILNFLNACGLEVNQGKTTMTEYMTKQKRWRLPGITPELTVTECVEGRLEDKLVTDKEYSRILGGNLQNNLSWNSHLTSGKRALLPAIRRQLGAISSLRNVLTRKAKLQLANSYILSRFSYIACLWGNTTDNNIRKAQVVLNTAARFVLNARKTTRQIDLMKGCDWLSIVELTEMQSLIQLWKVLRQRVPESLTDKFEMVEDDLVSTRRPRLLLTARGWRCLTTMRWNALPDSLRTEMSLSKFKTGLKRHIKERRERPPDPD